MADCDPLSVRLALAANNQALSIGEAWALLGTAADAVHAQEHVITEMTDRLNARRYDVVTTDGTILQDILRWRDRLAEVARG